MKNTLLILAILLFKFPAAAFLSVLDTSEILKTQEYEVSLSPQFIFDKHSGVNVVGRFDMGTGGDTSLRFLMGTGVTDFQLGGLFKLIPWPDYENQPGIGATAGVIFTSDNGTNGLHFRLNPLVSKRFTIEDFGDAIPYVSLPFGISATGGKSTYPLNIAVGSRWELTQVEELSFSTELGLNIANSFNYLSLNVIYPFE